MSLAVIDLDDLKEINDTHGHLVGDQVLRELAARMKSQLREEDLLARYAGDEFVAIFSAVDEGRALEIAERLLDGARRRPFEAESGAKIDLSLSIGVASYPSDARSSTGLLRAADMAMYVAKESGKNRVSSAGQSEHIRRRSNG
ncbi:MAG: GGDEF domain-containing protein [Thermomicrobiales bacterium]